MTHDELIEKTRAGLRWVLADVEPGTRVHELTDEEVEALARAAISVIAPAVLEEAMDAVVGYVHPDYEQLPGAPFATTAIRALKTRYE